MKQIWNLLLVLAILAILTNVVAAGIEVRSEYDNQSETAALFVTNLNDEIMMGNVTFLLPNGQKQFNFSIDPKQERKFESALAVNQTAEARIFYNEGGVIRRIGILYDTRDDANDIPEWAQKDIEEAKRLQKSPDFVGIVAIVAIITIAIMMRRK